MGFVSKVSAELYEHESMYWRVKSEQSLESSTHSLNVRYSEGWYLDIWYEWPLIYNFSSMALNLAKPVMSSKPKLPPTG